MKKIASLILAALLLAPLAALTKVPSLGNLRVVFFQGLEKYTTQLSKV